MKRKDKHKNKITNLLQKINKFIYIYIIYA